MICKWGKENNVDYRICHGSRGPGTLKHHIVFLSYSERLEHTYQDKVQYMRGWKESDIRDCSDSPDV